MIYKGVFRSDNEASDLKFVYTAMHGIGTPFAKRAFECFGLPPFITVDQQIHPDPDFSTVAFPNPEEGKGSLVCFHPDWKLIIMLLINFFFLATCN